MDPVQTAVSVAPQAEARAPGTLELHARACHVRRTFAGTFVHLRAVVEFTNVCHRNCLYCGMRRDNRKLERYGLDAEAIVSAAALAKAQGVVTVMLQGGDHLAYDVGALADAVRRIRFQLRQTVLLCIGDRPLADYERLRAAGAEQAILKFETSNERVYRLLRPHSKLGARLGLLSALAGAGYGVSSGFIFGLPGTGLADTERDLELCSELPLFAVSTSPFVPSQDAPLAKASRPSLGCTLDCLAALRLACPSLRIPSVSALNLLAQHERVLANGQLLGLQAGANVLTANFTPRQQQALYSIYSRERSIVEMEATRRIAAEARLSTA